MASPARFAYHYTAQKAAKTPHRQHLTKLPPLTAPTHMTPGRNDPCPCGSGKKYKKCCGATVLTLQSTDPVQAKANALKQVDRELEGQLTRFGKKRDGGQWMRRAADEYLGTEDQTIDPDELQLAVPWMFFHYVEEPTYRPIARDMRVAQDEKLPTDMRDMLDAQLAAWMSLWELQSVTPGVGMQLKDVLTGYECFVYETRATQTLLADAVIVARVVTIDSVSFISGMFPRSLPSVAADFVVRDIRKMCRVRTRPVDKAKLRNADLLTALITTWANAVILYDEGRAGANRMPTMQNTDGELMEITTDHFTIASNATKEVVRLLATLPNFETDNQSGSTTFVVTRPGNSVHSTWTNTVIGSVTVKGTRLIVESNSVKRADALRVTVEKALGNRVMHRLRDQSAFEQDMVAALGAMPMVHTPGIGGFGGGFGGSASGKDGPVPPEFAELMKKFKADHYRDWVNHALPALGGVTPLKAAKSAKGRATLEELLRDMEQGEARLPKPERFDFQELRTKLGL